MVTNAWTNNPHNTTVLRPSHPDGAYQVNKFQQSPPHSNTDNQTLAYKMLQPQQQPQQQAQPPPQQPPQQQRYNISPSNHMMMQQGAQQLQPQQQPYPAASTTSTASDGSSMPTPLDWGAHQRGVPGSEQGDINRQRSKFL